VPGEGLEPPTNGLQNRCSTAELTRQNARNVVVSVAFSIPAKQRNGARNANIEGSTGTNPGTFSTDQSRSRSRLVHIWAKHPDTALRT
jgi:hypothetical protein